MTQDKSRPGAVDYGLLLLLGLIWGASFLFIKLAVGTIPPITLTAGRLIVAGMMLVIITRIYGDKLVAQKGLWRTIALAALFGSVLPFTLISWGEEHIDSALAAILMSIMPLTTLVLAHLFTKDEKLNRYKLGGVLIGLAGLVILIGPSALNDLGKQSIRELAVAGAAICYGINALLTKRLAGQPPRAISASIINVSILMMVPASLLLESPLQLSPTTQAIWAVVVLGVFQTALATLLLVGIIKRQGANFFAQVNFIVPFVGVILGAVFLNEQIGLNAAIALGLIVTGIAVTRYGGIWAARRG